MKMKLMAWQRDSSGLCNTWNDQLTVETRRP